MTNQPTHVDGYCPICNAPSVYREPANTPDRNDKCANGHTYYMGDRLHIPRPEKQIVALGDDPVLKDVAAAHEPLTFVRMAVAKAIHQAAVPVKPVVAISIMSAGREVADQMIVFSPGGSSLCSANEALKRLQAATAQMEELIRDGAFEN